MKMLLFAIRINAILFQTYYDDRNTQIRRTSVTHAYDSPLKNPPSPQWSEMQWKQSKQIRFHPSLTKILLNKKVLPFTLFLCIPQQHTRPKFLYSFEKLLSKTDQLIICAQHQHLNIHTVRHSYPNPPGQRKSQILAQLKYVTLKHGTPLHDPNK